MCCVARDGHMRAAFRSSLCAFQRSQSSRLVAPNAQDTVGRHFYVGSDILAKEELLTMEGYIEEILPDGRFAVTLDNQHRIIAYTAGKMRKFRIRSVVGDRVHVEMTPYDLSKGRIVFRERTPGQGGGPGGARRGNFRR